MVDKLVKLPRRTIYLPRDGSVGLMTEDIGDDGEVGRYLDWHDCRETFQEEFTTQNCPNTIYWYKTDRPLQTRVRRFIAAVEDRLGLPASQRAVFRKTTDPTALQIRLGRFWRDEVRLSLFTILLRAGCYFKTSVRNALAEEEYSKCTMPAVEKFLAGHTRWDNDEDQFMGWVFEFDQGSLETSLKLPRGKKNVTAVGAGVQGPRGRVWGGGRRPRDHDVR